MSTPNTTEKKPGPGRHTLRHFVKVGYYPYSVAELLKREGFQPEKRTRPAHAL